MVVALSLVFFATRYAYGLYETSTLLVIAYAILNFPLGARLHPRVGRPDPAAAAGGRTLARPRPIAVFRG